MVRYQIDIARDGLTALGMVNESDYDVMILDIMMPKMDGIEVLRRVKGGAPGDRRHHDHRPARYRDGREGHEIWRT